MAGKAKDRVFAPYGESTLLGVADYDVKLPNGNSQTAKVVGPMSYDAFVAYLASDEISEKEKAQAFTFHWRGREAMQAQKVRLLNDTVVTIPGTSKQLDLMAIPVEVAVQAINVHDLGIKVLSSAAAKLAADDETPDDDDEMDEDAEKAARKNRAWNNARRFLVESGKVVVNADDTLAVNLDYVAPAMSGSSDLEIVNTFLDSMDEPVANKRRKRK